MARVLVLGGGFGGLAAAHELRRLLPDEHTVTVVDRQEKFFVGFAKLWDLGGLRPLADGTRELTSLPDHGIEFVRTDIATIIPESRTVGTADGLLHGDFVVVALGSSYDRQQVAWLGDAEHNLYDPAALPAMRQALDGLGAGRVLVAVLGVPYVCPPAPFEAAFLVDDRLRQAGRREAVEVAVAGPMPTPLPVAGAAASQRLADALTGRGIELLLDRTATGIDGDGRAVLFETGDPAGYDVLLAVPRHVPPVIVKQSLLAGDSGWIEPDRHTLRTAYDGFYGVGDCTLVPTAARPLPKAGVFAEAQGLVAARNIAAEILGGDGATFDGHGFCFLEFPERQAAFVQGDFFAEPAPAVDLSPPDTATFEAKQEFERERLDAWLPA